MSPRTPHRVSMGARQEPLLPAPPPQSYLLLMRTLHAHLAQLKPCRASPHSTNFSSLLLRGDCRQTEYTLSFEGSERRAESAQSEVSASEELLVSSQTFYMTHSCIISHLTHCFCLLEQRAAPEFRSGPLSNSAFPIDPSSPVLAKE